MLTTSDAVSEHSSRAAARERGEVEARASVPNASRACARSWVSENQPCVGLRGLQLASFIGASVIPSLHPVPTCNPGYLRRTAPCARLVHAYAAQTIIRAVVAASARRRRARRGGETTRDGSGCSSRAVLRNWHAPQHKPWAQARTLSRARCRPQTQTHMCASTEARACV